MRRYNPEIDDPTGMLMSEKYDGVQARWNGRRLTTREGRPICAPDWWTHRLPNDVSLIGELWMGRGTFDRVSAVVRIGTQNYWHHIVYMVFDPMDYPVVGVVGRYSERVRQIRCMGKQHLDRYLSNIISLGGEGVVLRRFDRIVHAEMLKVKPVYDIDGEMVGINLSKTNTVKSIRLRLEDGRIINLSTGLPRRHPGCQPNIGRIVKFTHDGYTSTGLPRHPRYLGIRADNPMAESV